jgi:response regulator RpfG family c-di-GMP phosphodiesterase
MSSFFLVYVDIEIIKLCLPNIILKNIKSNPQTQQQIETHKISQIQIESPTTRRRTERQQLYVSDINLQLIWQIKETLPEKKLPPGLLWAAPLWHIGQISAVVFVLLL